MVQPSKWLEIEQKYGESMEQLLPRLANELGNLTAVAERLDVTFTTVWKWSNRIGMERVCVYAVPGQTVRINGEARR